MLCTQNPNNDHIGCVLAVIPQPVYMNSEELEQQPPTKSLESPEDDLKTPTVEELSFPGQQKVVIKPFPVSFLY